MNNKTLSAILLSAVLLIGIFVPIAFAPQPPLISNTLLAGTIPGVAYRIDPHSAYDTASATIDMNVYDTLIWFDRNTSALPENQGLVGQFIPQLAYDVPTEANGLIQHVYLDIYYNCTPPNDDFNPLNPFFTTWWDAPHGNEYSMFDWIDNTNDGILTAMDVVYVEQVTISGYAIPCTTHAWSVVAIQTTGVPPPFNAHLQLRRNVFYFQIRTGVKIQPWIAQNGTVMSNPPTTPQKYLTPQDCEYSFESGMITNIAGGPMFMFYLPMFDQMTLGYWSVATAGYYEAKLEAYGYSLTKEQRLLYGGRLIDCNVVSNTTHFWLSLGLSFPLTAWYQIVAQSWGSIVPKAFMLDKDCWNGTWVGNPSWPASGGSNGQAIWFYWRRWPDPYMSPLDMHTPHKTPCPGDTGTVGTTGHPAYTAAHGEHVACGTGPYKFTYYDNVLDEWRIDRFTGYWQGWVPDAIHPYYLDTIIMTGVESWTTRKDSFLAGDFDTVAVNRDVMHQLMQEDPPGSGNWVPLPGIVTHANLPALTSESLHYVQAVATGSPYMPTIAGQNVSTFFSNVHARKAFSYALNFTTYIKDAWLGEAVRSTTWYVAGLSPDWRLSTAELPPYDIDMAKVEEELRAAVYYVGGTPWSLWNGTWTLKLLYNSGSSARRIPLEMIQSVFAELDNSAPGSFGISILSIDWDTFINNIYSMVMPTFLLGWLVDYAHPDDWVRPYMHSQGDFVAYQGYANATVDYEITLAMKTDNATLSKLLYEDLQREFIRANPTLILAQPTGRAWMRNWVQGWYYNPILPGAYYRDRWKGFLEDFNRDLKVNIGDLIKLLLRFGHTVPPEDPIFDLNKDGKIGVLDFVKCAMAFGKGVP